MDIYTAHISYAGEDRLDVTVKGNVFPGNFLAPTWEMVRPLQQGKMTEKQYMVAYFSLLMGRLWNHDMSTRTAINTIRAMPQVTFVCYCAPDTFCHRILAAHMFENLGWGTYRGERHV